MGYAESICRSMVGATLAVALDCSAVALDCSAVALDCSAVAPEQVAGEFPGRFAIAYRSFPTRFLLASLGCLWANHLVRRGEASAPRMSQPSMARTGFVQALIVQLLTLRVMIAAIPAPITGRYS